MRTLDELKEHFPQIDFCDNYLKIINDISTNEKVNLNIIGKAGTGKSTILKILHYMLNDKNVVVCSTTATSSALLNEDNPEIKATTVHSFFGIKPQDVYGTYEKTPSEKLLNRVRAIDYLIIDECGMMTSDFFDYLMMIIERCCGANTPSIILFGDILQLPPVVKTDISEVNEVYSKVYDNHFYYFNTFSFRENHFRTYLMEKIYRQKDDLKFAEVLNRIRDNSQTQEDLDFINARVMDEGDFLEQADNYLTICTTNKEVFDRNKIAMDILDGKWMIYESDIHGNFRDSAEGKSGNYPDKLFLKIGCQVMVTRNAPINEETGERDYYNGMIGTLIGETTLGLKIEVGGSEIIIPTAKTSVYEYDLGENENGKVIVTPRETGSYTNFPLRVCYSLTLHKCQGKTIPKGFISLGHWIPENGIYTLLSRFRCMNDFALENPIKMSDIKTNKEAIKFIKDTEYNNELDEDFE